MNEGIAISPIAKEVGITR
ncbi:hypothetical protein CFN03_12810 [Salinicoccus roseus]|uniref:Uncharacterized protein n=1 Tax=Salinicoccus roseus TaxID=45670 RepID=A0A265E3S9_9STAP|nr:hypothetical protein CFN03_12810 [Salinicoccus roseus]